jgi:hypothetical protein
MKLVVIVALGALLAGCGSEGGGGSKNELAASACDAYAKNQLEGKTYKLDTAVLAASMAPTENGAQFLHGPIVVEPGRNSESKLSLECTVRFVDGKETPDVLKMLFIW